jgi:acyl-CoA thioesterase I
MISRRQFISVAAALLALCASGCGSSPSAPSAGVTVIAFGDSITFGFGASDGNDYPALLARRTGVPVINAGRNGDTTGSALNRVDSAVLSRNPDIVIVFLGGNDLLQGVPVEQRIANITTIVQRIRADGAAVILVGVGSGILDPFNGQLPTIASQTSSTLVPNVLDGVFGVPGFMSDAIHPNDAGHVVIADRIEPALRSALAAAGS